MQHRRDLDVSVVLPFADDEERVGGVCRHLAEHLRSLGLRFELIAVDEASTDNCAAVLALLRVVVPELRVVVAGGRDRGYATGAQLAVGRVLWLIDVAGAQSPLAPFWRAYQRVVAQAADLEIVEHRFVVCHRARCLGVLDRTRGRGDGYQDRLARRAAARRLVVERHGTAGARGRGLHDRWLRLLGALAPARW